MRARHERDEIQDRHPTVGWWEDGDIRPGAWAFDGAGVGPQQTGGAEQQRGFPRPCRSGDSHDFALDDVEIDAAEHAYGGRAAGDAAAIRFLERAERQDGGHRRARTRKCTGGTASPRNSRREPSTTRRWSSCRIPSRNTLSSPEERRGDENGATKAEAYHRAITNIIATRAL